MIRNARFLHLLLYVAFIGAGCDIVIQSSSPTNVASLNTNESSVSNITTFDDEVITTVTPVDVRNCGGGITTRTVSYRSAVENAIEWRIGVQVGVGATIGSGFLPGGLNLNTILSSEIAPELRVTTDQLIAHTLEGPPEAIMRYQIQWDITWRNVALLVTTPAGTSENIQVRYVANINSQIIGEQRLSCAGDSVVVVPTSLFEIRSELTPTSLPIIITATPLPVVVSNSSSESGRACYCTPAGCDLHTLLSPGETFNPAPQSSTENPYYLIYSSRNDGYYYWQLMPVNRSYTCQNPETGCSAWGYYSSQSCAISEAERECRARGSSCAGVNTYVP